MSLLQNLRLQNEKIIAENIQMKKDIQLVALELKKTWQNLGIDLSKFENGEKPGKMQLLAMLPTIIGKVSKPDSIASITESWNKVSPILSQYQYLIQEENV